MPEAPKIPHHMESLTYLPVEHGLPVDFKLPQMHDLSLREVGEMESYLNSLPSNPGIKETLKAIEGARLAGIGPFEGTLPPLAISQKVENLIGSVRFLDETQFPTPKRIEALKALTPEEGTVLQEALGRLKHQHLAMGDPFAAEGVDNFLRVATEHTAPKILAKPLVTETVSPGATLEHSAAKAEQSWISRISKERWLGKKGLMVTGAVVGVGAIIYGATKLLGHNHSSDNQHSH
jgi:hypothetical protein